MDFVASLAHSIQGRLTPELCKKSLASVQNKIKTEQYKKSLATITFQNKVALRQSLKPTGSPLGDCVDTAVDLPDPEETYTGPNIEPGHKITQQFVFQLREWFRVHDRLPVQILYRVLQQVEKHLRSETGCLREITISSDQVIHVAGDIHGQFKDLNNIFFLKGDPSSSNLYLFNGDIVDRGPDSLQCIILLLAWRAASPDVVFINRGNHEAQSMNEKDGFQKELNDKYNDNFLFEFFQEVFSLLPAATVVSKRVMVVHGGLSAVKDLELEDIRNIPRGRCFQPEEHDILCDLLWSDPMQVGNGVMASSRGGGCIFGGDVTADFLTRNNLQCIVRSHTEIKEGCGCSHPGCYTVFSAPNKHRGILGGVMTLHPTEGEDMRLEGFVFQQIV